MSKNVITHSESVEARYPEPIEERHPEPAEERHPEPIEERHPEPAEGYTKFISIYTKKDCLNSEDIKDLVYYRSLLYAQGFVGMTKDKISYGNLSKRVSVCEFIISGTNTGKPMETDKEHYSKVKVWDIKRNLVVCEGLCAASSETLSHAAIYEKIDSVNAVIHIHSDVLWRKYIHNLPTTSKYATYGTVDLAFEIQSLLEKKQTLKEKIIILAGHPEGIILFGNSIEDAYNNKYITTESQSMKLPK